MSEVPHDPEGQVIEGRYRVISRIADGGMATVYQAVDERLDRTVAIKIMHTQLAQGPQRDQFVERFRREARSAAAIANPHIVQVYDTGEFNGLDYLVMEYVHGVNLRYEMNQQGTFSVRETLRIIGETLDGLASAHRAGVVHRDIKPENILLNDRGHVQITDFGLAKAVSQATLSSTGMLLGTAAYLAPEMIEKNLATPQGDLYSVGIMAWEMLAGKVPFTADNPVTLVFKHVHEDVPGIATVCTGINADVAAFIAHLAARAVDARPDDASAALEELQRLQSTLSIDDWQYRLPAETDSSITTPQNVSMPPAPPVPSTRQLDDRTRHINQNPNATTVMPASQSYDADATARLPLNTDVPHTEDPASTLLTAQGTDKPSRRRGHVPIVIAIVAAIVLAGACGGWTWWYFRGPGSYWTMPQPADLKCPTSKACRITNVKWESYKELLKFSNIEYETTEAFSDSVEAGDVISTNPADVGAHVSKRHHQKVKVLWFPRASNRQRSLPTSLIPPAQTARIQSTR